jgi:hypothetical protein
VGRDLPEARAAIPGRERRHGMNLARGPETWYGDIQGWFIQNVSPIIHDSSLTISVPVIVFIVAVLVIVKLLK